MGKGSLFRSAIQFQYGDDSDRQFIANWIEAQGSVTSIDDLTIAPGWWIILTNENTFKSMSNDEFQKTYEL